MHPLQSYQENNKSCKMDVLNLRSLKETKIQSILESATGINNNEARKKKPGFTYL